jgi:phytoene synthase
MSRPAAGLQSPVAPQPAPASPAHSAGWNERRERAYCRRLTRRSGSSFYYSFLLLPRVRRHGIYAVYAFCRAVDDVVDGGSCPDPAAELQAWREEVLRAFAGWPSHPITRQLVRLREPFGVREEHLLEILRGVEMDLLQTRYERVEDLYYYCYRVAGVVGLVCAHLFGHRDPGTREYAVSLGVGFQMVNILRDLAPDARRGRIYLPLEDLRRHGCREAEILRGEPGEGFEPLIRFECERTRELLRHARRRLPHVDRGAMWPAEAMAAVYERLLAEIEADPRRALKEGVQVPRWRKAALALAARLGRA